MIWLTLLPGLFALAFSPPPEDLPEMIPMSVPLTSRGFEHIGRDYGVDVYQHRNSKIICIAGEGRIAAPPELVRRTLLDYERHPAMLDRVAVSRILNRAEHRMLVYQRLDLPLISDRDFNLQVRWGQHRRLHWIHYRSSPYGVSPQPGVVRVLHHRGSWQLMATPDGRSTFARYQSSIDLAGLLPSWMARSGAGDEVPELFVAIRKMVAAAERDAASHARKARTAPLAAPSERSAQHRDAAAAR